MKDVLYSDALALVAHELRGPMTSVIGWVQVLQADPLPAEVRARAIETIMRNARVQQRLIQDLFDYARIGHGTLQLELAALDVAQLAVRAAEDWRPAARAREVEIELDRDGPAEVIGDPDRLGQVLSNLLGNAVKFSPQGGKVVLHVERVAHQVKLRVRDSGVGIARELLPHVFDRFGRGHAQGNGLGLGLTLVRRIVDLHGGHVAVESDGPGRGATFTVTLPHRDHSLLARAADNAGS